jgi:cytochrome c-type biogenesis protein CcmE
MTRKQRRGVLIAGGVGVLMIAGLLVMSALRDTIVFFHTPSEVAKGKVKPGQRFRLGGLVSDGSVKRGAGTDVEFAITDKTETLPVRYQGILPDLFREGQGVIAEGKIDNGGVFRADTVLAKHDETYMPPEVAKALKEQGVWQGGEGKMGGEGKPSAQPVKGQPKP